MMETTMSDQGFTTGDRVRHATKPEWGVGTVIKVEAAAEMPQNGHPRQRLSIRFPNAGQKTLISGFAELIRVNGNDAFGGGNGGDSPLVEYWNKMSETDWLGSVARKKVEQAMITLPEDVRDPFNSLTKRLSLTLGLYRFDRSGRGLMDWAVAQTGLDDPLSRFSRQELEQKFDRWAMERDNHLIKLLQEARSPGVDAAGLSAAVKLAPPAGRDAVRRFSAPR